MTGVQFRRIAFMWLAVTVAGIAVAQHTGYRDGRAAAEADVAALKAAMTGGTAAWGSWGSASEHNRYIEPTENKRRRCHCGCKGAKTHRGMANGVCLTTGCDLSMRRWVRDPCADLRRKRLERHPELRPDPRPRGASGEDGAP